MVRGISAGTQLAQSDLSWLFAATHRVPSLFMLNHVVSTSQSSLDNTFVHGQGNFGWHPVGTEGWKLAPCWDTFVSLAFCATRSATNGLRRVIGGLRSAECDIDGGDDFYEYGYPVYLELRGR